MLGVPGWPPRVWAAGPVDTETAVPQRITTVIRPDLRTGKLVRSVIVTSKPVAEQRVAEAPVAPRVVSPVPVHPAPTAPRPPASMKPSSRSPRRMRLPPQLIHSVIKVESNYNPYAISPKGAQGLMQLIPATARRFGVSNDSTRWRTFRAASKYLKYLLDLYGGNYPLALAAYNAGEGGGGQVWRRAAVPRNQNYLILVARQLQEAKKAEAAKQKA